MNEEQKDKAKEVHGRVAVWLEGLGVPANWAKVGAGLIIGSAIGGLSTCQQSCKTTPHVKLTVEQVQLAHDAYHVITGEPCHYEIVPAVDYKK